MADLVPGAPWSAALSLDDTLRRLRHSRRIIAIGFLGSTGTAQFSAASDYDLLLLAEDYPAGYGIEATIIGHRIADIVIVGADEAATGWNPATMTDDLPRSRAPRPCASLRPAARRDNRTDPRHAMGVPGTPASAVTDAQKSAPSGHSATG